MVQISLISGHWLSNTGKDVRRETRDVRRERLNVVVYSVAAQCLVTVMF